MTYWYPCLDKDQWCYPWRQLASEYGQLLLQIKNIPRKVL